MSIFKRFMPKGLFGRTLLIIVLPVGLMQVAVDGRENDEWGTVVGLRNSHDKRFPAGLAMGAAPFVCDNLAFNGQVVLARKHTTNIMRDLPGVTARAVGKLRDFSGQAERRANSYKVREMGNREAHDLIIRALDAQAINFGFEVNKRINVRNVARF